MLLVAMLGIAIMAIQGSIAASTSLNNITTSVKSRSVQDASAVAEAGIAEAKARLQGLPGTNARLIGDPLATLNLVNPAPNALWTAYILTSNNAMKGGATVVTVDQNGATFGSSSAMPRFTVIHPTRTTAMDFS
jgi:hypothetical protein